MLLTFTAGSYYYLWSRLFAVDTVGKGLTHRAMQYIFRMIMSFNFHAVFSNNLIYFDQANEHGQRSVLFLLYLLQITNREINKSQDQKHATAPCSYPRF